MTTTAVPVVDKGLEFHRNQAVRDLGVLNSEIRRAASLSELLKAVQDCIPLLQEMPSEECAAIYRHQREIKLEIKRRSEAVGKR